MHRNKNPHSITLWARLSNGNGTAMPRAFATVGVTSPAARVVPFIALILNICKRKSALGMQS
jgi:hypothetical protein